MTLLSSSMPASHRAEIAEYRRHVYVSTGWGKLKRWNGFDAALLDAGIAGPSGSTDSWTPTPTTAAGNVEAGVHLFRYRYLDSRTGYVSNPSEERSVTVTGSKELTFAIAANGSAATNVQRVPATETKADRIVLEATTSGGSEFYKIAEVAMTETEIVADMDDATLVVQFLPWPEDGHDVPPVAQIVVSHEQRLWLFGQVEHTQGDVDVTNASVDVAAGTDPGWVAEALGDGASVLPSVAWLFQVDGDATAYEVSYYDAGANKLVLKTAYQGSTQAGVAYKLFSRADVIWVSRAGYPEGFQPLKYLQGPNGSRAGDLTAGIGYGPFMLFFTASGLWRLSWDVDPIDDTNPPRLAPAETTRGALSQRVVVDVQGVVYALDRLGVYAWSGTYPVNLSRPVDELLDSIDWSLSDRFHAAFFPRLRAVRWHVCFTGDTYPKNYLQFDVDTRTWSTGTLGVGVSESRLVPTEEGLQVYYGDENGFVWQADTGTCDGVDAAYSHLTVAAGTTAGFLVTDETLPTSDSGLAGALVYWVEGDETQRIASNVENGIVLVEAFSSPPAADDTLWLGGIDARLKSKAFSAPRSGTKKKTRGRYLWLFLEPLAAARRALLRFFDDYSATAKSWGQPPNDLPGVTKPAVATPTLWEVALGSDDDGAHGGVRRVPVGSDWNHAREFELILNEPDSRVELFGLELETGAVEEPR